MTPEGIVESVTIRRGERGYLDAMYEVLGCRLVDVVRLAGDLEMWVDDEGLVLDREINPVATVLAAGFGFDHQPYVGTVLFLGGVDDEGDSLPLSPERHEQMLRLARRCALMLGVQS